MGDYYELLGVTEDATTEEIERAYRERLKETHPDVSDSADASRQTKRLIDAKETLTDEAKRARYDRLGHESAVENEGGQPTSTGDDPETDDSGAADSRRETAAGRSTENVGSGAAWARTGGQERAAVSESNPQQVREAESADAAGRVVDVLRRRIRDRHSVAVFAPTFLTYPALLFGTLYTGFHPAVNLVVAVCLVFVVAFLQSVPAVGIAVFGGWTLLLPPVLFVGFGLGPLSLQAVFALTAVVFPLGLSLLTRVALRPVSVG